VEIVLPIYFVIGSDNSDTRRKAGWLELTNAATNKARSSYPAHTLDFSERNASSDSQSR